MTYEEEIEAFRRDREAGFRKDDGWLTQVALEWLEDGFVELEIGSFSRIDGGARFVAKEGVDVRIDGALVREATLHCDHGAECPDVLVHGRKRYRLIERGGAFAVRVRDADAPARFAFRGLRWYPIDRAWRIVGRLLPRASASNDVMQFTGGQEEIADVPGVLTFRVGDREHELVPYARRDGSLLVVFRDETNADETFELCRYFYAAPPDGEGNVVLDFNRAAAPICALVPTVTCVLPPPENRLALRVEAGERR